MIDQLRHVQLDTVALTSQISGRSVLVNPSWTKAAVAPAITSEALEAARANYEAYLVTEDATGLNIRRSRAETMAAAYQRKHGDDGTKQGKGAHGRFASLREPTAGAGLPYMGIRPDTVAVTRALFESPSRAGFARALDSFLEHRALVVDQVRKKAYEKVIAAGDQSGGPPTLLSGVPFDAVSTKVHPGLAPHLTEVLAILWAHGLIALPTSGIWSEDHFLTYRGVPRPIALCYGSALPGVEALAAATPRQGRVVKRARFFMAVWLSVIGARDAGDFDEAVMEKLAAGVPDGMRRSQFMKGISTALDAVRHAQMTQYGDGPTARFIPSSFRPLLVRYAAVRSDATFAWAAQAGDGRAARWAEYAGAYIADKTLRLALDAEVPPLNHLLDWVIADPSVPGDPFDVCARAREYTASLQQYFGAKEMKDATRSSNMRRVARFFEWLLDTYRVDEHGHRTPGYRNPLPERELPSQPPRGAQTAREAMPLRFMRVAREILEENDFAWARTIQSDYFSWRNPATGKFERVWSPVRASLFLLRFIVPIREFQARVLDSGEGDSMVYRGGRWLPNTGRLVADRGAAASPQGFIRQIADLDLGGYINGIFINTNKSADRANAYTAPGYEIPWDSPEVLSLFEYVRDWQERYNPCTRGLTRAELTDGVRLVSEDVAKRLPKLHFLLRDAAYPRAPLEPPTEGRLDSFWKLLMTELEKRLAAQGVTNPDGSPFQIVLTRTAVGDPQKMRYDTHSLRVSGLSRLAQAGVPLQVLSQIAGHSTLVMTLYYVKVSSGEITKALDEASVRFAELEQRDWEARLMQTPIDRIHEIAWYASDAARDQLRPDAGAVWEQMEEGICPNGATRCGDGGPEVINISGRVKHAPVPGGARNCVMCRFFATGPAFLGGLVARFNDSTAKVRDAALELREAEAARRELVAQGGGTPQDLSYQRALRQADRRVDTATETLDTNMQTWTAALRLVRRVQESLRDPADPSGARPNRIVLNGTAVDFKLQFEQVSPFSLWDRVCHQSIFYPSSDTRLPSIRRGRVLDAVLARDGRPAVFATLSEAEALQVGNAVTTLLRTRLGDDGLDGLICGAGGLSSFGLEDEVLQLVQQAEPVVIESSGASGIVVARPALPSAAPQGSQESAS